VWVEFGPLAPMRRRGMFEVDVVSAAAPVGPRRCEGGFGGAPGIRASLSDANRRRFSRRWTRVYGRGAFGKSRHY